MWPFARAWNRVLLPCVVGLLLAAANASAQEVVLSDNLSASQGGEEIVTATRWVTASFGTDAHDYLLTSVALWMASGSGSGPTAQLDIYTSVGPGVGTPGLLVGTLAAPASIPTVLSKVSFTASGIVLDASSTYWVVLTAQGAGDLFTWEWADTDSGTGVGFQHTWGFSEDSGGSWQTFDTLPQIMQVNAKVAGGSWVDLGFALPGVSGKPRLGAGGPLLPATDADATLAKARPGALALLVSSARRLDQPFQGGVLVPALSHVTAFLVDAAGGLAFTCPVPPGLPSGAHLYMQFWIEDPAGPAGFSASNALQATLP